MRLKKRILIKSAFGIKVARTILVGLAISAVLSPAKKPVMIRNLLLPITNMLFGLGDAVQIDSLDVFWAGGAKQTLNNIKAGKYYHLVQGSELSELKRGR